LRLLKPVSFKYIFAYNLNVSGDHYELFYFQAPASPPQDLEVTLIDSRSVYLSWSPPLREHHNGIIRQFWINVTEVDTGRRYQMTSFGSSLTISSLHPFYTYEFSVAAYTIGPGPFSEPSVQLMPQDGKCEYETYVIVCIINPVADYYP